jgi:thiol-disulfide isomerase/thioredoxin
MNNFYFSRSLKETAIKTVLLSLMLLSPIVSRAQLSDGSAARDFTFTDIKGNKHNLYTYLNQGKYVAIDVSATWCEPCWTYHKKGVMDSLFNKYDSTGTNQWKILFIEEDKNTTSADLLGTGSNTQGNWVQGTDFPIIDPSASPELTDFLFNYDINTLPTLMIICPDKKVYQSVLNKVPRPSVSVWDSFANASCKTNGIENLQRQYLKIFPDPAKDLLHIMLNENMKGPVGLTVYNALGQPVDNRNYANTENKDQEISYPTISLKPGLYFLKIESGNHQILLQKFIVGN